MPITVNKEDVTGSVGNASQVVIIEQPSFNEVNGSDLSSPIEIAANGDKTGGDAHKFQGSPSNIDIALQGALIAAGVFTGSLGRSPGYPGRLSVQNGFALGGSPMIAPLILRGLLQDKDPAWHILNGTGTTLPAAVTAVDSQALAATTAKTVAEDLASTTNPVRLTVALEDAALAVTVDVVDGETIGGTAAIAINDNLRDYDVPFQLTVNPSANANAASNPTITINGTGGNGRSLSEELTFTSDSPQTTTNYFLTVTSIARTGWAASETVDITATIVEAVTIGEGKELASVRVEGTDHADNVIAESFFFDADTLSDDQTGSRYFATITEVTSKGWAGGAFDITAQDKAARVTIASEEEKAFCYHKLEVTRGLIPEVIDDNVVQQVTLALSADDVLRYAIVYLGRIGYHQQNLGGDTGSTARKTDASALEFPTEDYWIGWQGQIFVEGLELAMQDATLTLQKQWTQPGTIGSQVEGAQPIADTFLGTLTGNTIYATQNDFNENFVDNIPFSNVELRLTNKLKGGFKSQLRILAGKGELNANPVPTVGATGQILQSLELNLLPSKAGLTDYIKIVIDIPEYDRLRVYA